MKRDCYNLKKSNIIDMIQYKTKLFVIIALLLSIPFSCKQVINSANQFMNGSKFETLVERFEGAERDAYQQPQKVMAYIGNVQDETIMDIGAGTGYFSFRLVNAGAQVIAADIDDRFLNFIKNKRDSLKIAPEKIELRKVLFDSPLLEKEEVDKAIIVNTYHHLDNRVDYFTKVQEGIKNDGSLIVIDFYKKPLEHGPPMRYKVSADEVVAELKKAGFTRFKKEMELLDMQYIVTAYKN